MVAGTVGGDLNLILHLGTLRSGSDLAVLDGIAGGLEEAQSSGLGGGILVIGAHAGGVDGLAIDIHGESHLIAGVSCLRSSPGGVGDGVVDHAGTLAIVGLDAQLTVSGKHSGQTLTQVLGGLGTGIAAHVHGHRGDTHVAVAQVIHGVDGDLVAVQLAVAVLLLDSVHGVGAEGRIGDINGAGDDAVELIGLLRLQEVDVLDLGSAQIVGIVGLEVHSTVFELNELVGAGAHGLGGDGTDMGQIALVEAELVVGVIVLVLLTIVVHRSDHNAQLIHGGSGDLAEHNTHAVIAGLLDTGDAGSGLTEGDSLGGGGVHIRRQQIGQSGTGSLSLHGGEVPVILGSNGQEEILSGSIVSQAIEAPAGSSGLDIALGNAGVSDHVVHDLLSELHTAVVDGIPESLLSGLVNHGEISAALTQLAQILGHGGHTGTVLGHTLNGLSVQGGTTVIGGVAQNVHGEDDVVDGDGLAIGELQIVTQGEIIVHGAVGVLGDGHVGRTIVSIVGAIVAAGLALDALLNDSASTVASEQTECGHGVNILIVSSL